MYATSGASGRQGYIRQYVHSDAAIVAAHLRGDDLREIAASTGVPARDALRLSAGVSDIACTVCSADGSPVAIFGVGAGGSIWLLGTDALTRPPLVKQFLRECRQHVALLQDRYPLLYNRIDARNTLHMRWLRWMGFTFIRRIPDYGVERREFLEFAKVTTHV